MNRQEFLKNSLLSAVGLSATPVFAEKAARFSGKNTPSVSGVKITNVRTFGHPKALFVKIETDAGISGWGEGDHDHIPIVAKVVRELGKPHLVGEDPFESEYLWNKIFFLGEDIGTNGVATGALAGIDNALWDLKGKLLGLPVYKMLGGNKIEKIKVYGSFGRGEGKGVKKCRRMWQNRCKIYRKRLRYRQAADANSDAWPQS